MYLLNELDILGIYAIFDFQQGVVPVIFCCCVIDTPLKAATGRVEIFIDFFVSCNGLL